MFGVVKNVWVTPNLFNSPKHFLTRSEMLKMSPPPNTFFDWWSSLLYRFLDWLAPNYPAHFNTHNTFCPPIWCNSRLISDKIHDSARKAIRTRRCGPNTLLPTPFLGLFHQNAGPCCAQALICSQALLCRILTERRSPPACFAAARNCFAVPRPIRSSLVCCCQALLCCAQACFVEFRQEGFALRYEYIYIYYIYHHLNYILLFA